MKYGFIGSGNMAGAILAGLIKSDKHSHEKFWVYNPREESREKFANRFGINLAESLESIFNCCDMIFLAVKPNMYPSVLEGIRPYIEKKTVTLISMAAGCKISDIEKILSVEAAPIIRIMPNMNSEIGMGMTSLCANTHVSARQKEAVTTLLDCIGMTVELEEKYFGIYSAIAGCSPAFTYLFIDSLAKGAQKMGMKKSQALAIAAQTVMGSAKMLMESEEHPWELIDKVCSPGGLTIEGICTLEDFRFESALVHAIENIVEKDNRGYLLNPTETK